MKRVFTITIALGTASCAASRVSTGEASASGEAPGAGVSPPTITLRQAPPAEPGPRFLAERGARVEILGLGHWTPAMLRDSLAVHAPGVSIASTTLAVTLRERLGFPEAMAREQAGDSAVNILVAVIEPRESHRIRRRALGADTLESRAPSSWVPIVELAGTRLDLLSDALEAPVYARTVGLPPAVPLEVRPDSIAVRQVWAGLESHQSTEGAATARRMLTSSPNVYDRLAAVAILSSFERDDAAWHALVGAALDPDPRVRGLAVRVLDAFTRQAPRQVDWRPAAEALHAILDGSALAALASVLNMLVATGAGPDLAGPLLRDGGHAVLMFAAATNPAVRLPSHRFLRAVSGRREGATPAEWRDWIEGLSR